MITPQFEVTQDDRFLFVQIRAPYIKASHIQFEVSDDVFVFSLPPYYLRLRFPGNIKEDEHMTSSYDLSKSLVHCKVSKMNAGEHFADLDMLTKLLATKRQQEVQKGPLIQEVDVTAEELAEKIAEPDFDWEVDQAVNPGEDTSSVKYGFNNQYCGRVGLSMHTGNEINELKDPEQESAPSKRALLRETTTDQFDAEHYAADLEDEDLAKSLLSFKFPSELKLDILHKDRALKLGQREFLISDLKPIYVGIIPLVFAWAYDYRVNYGDTSVESSWTVGKLAPSMSFLCNNYIFVKDVVEDCTALALTKPLYRIWALVEKVWQDTLNIMKGGKSNIFAVFCYLLGIFESEIHSVYRNILIEDYAMWIQYSSDKVIQGMCTELEKSITNLTKEAIYLPLKETESLVRNSVRANQTDSDDDSSSASD